MNLRGSSCQVRPPMFLRLVVIVEFVIGVLPLSAMWAFETFVLVAIPVSSWVKAPATFSFFGLIFVVWMLACGAGLWSLWDLFFRYPQYSLMGVPRRVKIGATFGLIALLPFVLPGPAGLLTHSHYPFAFWIGPFLFYSIPACLLYQFRLLIVKERRSNIAVERDASPHGGSHPSP